MPHVDDRTILYQFAPLLQVCVPTNHSLQVVVLICTHWTSLCMSGVIISYYYHNCDTELSALISALVIGTFIN